jgi:hypothetical protein
VSSGDGAPLRVALLYHTLRWPPGPGVERTAWKLASSLRDAGHQPSVLTSHLGPTHREVQDGILIIRSTRLPEAPLRWRGFDGPLTHVPLTVTELAIGRYDVAHAFSPPDAFGALLWRRLAGRPVAYTSPETLKRRSLADRRLRLRLLAHAVQDSDAVIAPTEEARLALWRWLAVDALVIDPAGASEHLRLYGELQARRR